MRTLVTLIGFTHLLLACDCVEFSQSQSFHAAKAVFDGVVQDVHYFDPETSSSVRVLVTFSVTRQWKGDVHPTIKVHASERALMCDSYSFEVGKRYIVYAIEQDQEAGWADRYPAGTNILSVGACILRIKTGNDAAVEAKSLGTGKVPD